jgi:hypothetical protein
LSFLTLFLPKLMNIAKHGKSHGKMINFGGWSEVKEKGRVCRGRRGEKSGLLVKRKL